MIDKSYVISIVSDKGSWINKYIDDFAMRLINEGYKVNQYNDHKDMMDHDIVFYFSYSKIVSAKDLSKNKHNLVVHESELPKGKGWSPLTWQIIEGKNTIPITLFEADEKVDAGKIYLMKKMRFSGSELVNELRKTQAQYTFDMAYEFIMDYDDVIANVKEQDGEESFYSRRVPKDSQLDVNKNIKEQFNILRIVDNDKYPAYFSLFGCEYELKICKRK